MARFDRRSYDTRIMLAMTVYVAVFMTVWPLARGSTDAMWKVVYALAPVLPLLYVIWVMAQRILRSDELQQRTHLIGLGVATVVVSIVSIVAGFLAAANVMTLESTSIVLVWIFPLLMIVYSIARSRAARRYGGGGFCDEDDRVPAWQRLLYGAFVSFFIWAIVYLRGITDPAMYLILALTAAQLVGAFLLGMRYRRRHRLPQE